MLNNTNYSEGLKLYSGNKFNKHKKLRLYFGNKNHVTMLR